MAHKSDQQLHDLDALLKAEEERIQARLNELESELSDLNLRRDRIHAYFNPPTSRDVPTPRLPRKQATDRAPRGEVQAKVLETVQANPTGLTKGQLKDKLPDLQDQSISNALDALKKQGRITWEGRGKPYLPAPQ